MAGQDEGGWGRIRRRTYEILELGRVGDTTSQIVDRALVALIVVNLAAITLESMPSLGRDYWLAFLAIEVVSSVVFTVEYVLRIWCSVEHAPLRHLTPLRARLHYALTGPAIVDLLAVVPFS
jgi:voltage-gated potassium channel